VVDRSLNGHTADPEQVSALASIREQFEQAARYEDD